MTAPTPDLAAWKAAAERATYYGGNEQEQADRILALIALVEQQAAEIERLTDERDHWKQRRDAAIELCRFRHQDGLTAEEWHTRICGAMEGVQRERARAEKAEAREAALVAKVEALADEWERDFPSALAACNREPDEWWLDLRTLLAEHATPSGPPCGEDKQRAARGVVHMAPEPGHGTTPCCRMVPFELPRDHRMTTTPKEVTCPAPASVETELSEEERRVLRCHCTRLDDVWHHERFCPVPAVGRILSDRLASAERERDVAEDQANAHAQDAIVAEAEVERLRAVVAAVEALDEGHIAADCRFPDDTCTCTIPLFTLRAALVTAPVQAGTGAEDGEGDRS